MVLLDIGDMIANSNNGEQMMLIFALIVFIYVGWIISKNYGNFIDLFRKKKKKAGKPK